MRNSKLILGVPTLFLFLLSCSTQEDNLAFLGDHKLEVETFFEEISSINLELDNENIIYITYQWDAKNKTIEYISSEEKEPDFFVLDKKAPNDDYTVECQNGDNSWNETCDGKFSCGRLIARCLDEGGCALTCQHEMAFAPQINTFYFGL
ncbi:MAG: hypothetical protein HRT68_01205 [Flavobacteriaceae bacterium]|nr:hypothetical protein [Flavobacteriaceae bacterium]